MNKLLDLGVDTVDLADIYGDSSITCKLALLDKEKQGVSILEEVFGNVRQLVSAYIQEP